MHSFREFKDELRKMRGGSDEVSEKIAIFARNKIQPFFTVCHLLQIELRWMV